MREHIGMLALAVGVGSVLLFSTIAYTVDELQDIVLIKTFGQITASREGEADAGLRFKWPWPIQRLVRYDKRTSVFEDTSSEVPTRDKQNMLVTMYCAWRIAEPEKFHRTIEHRDAAQERIRDLLRNYKKDVVGRYDMEDFINTDPEKMEIPRIEQEVFDLVGAEAKREYGIQVVRVGLKSLTLPESVTTAVIDAMKEERRRAARMLRSAGEAEATAIIERARSASTQIVEFAKRKAEEIRTEGYLAAAKYYAQYKQDYKLSMFLRSLESLKKQLQGPAVILMDGTVSNPAVKWLRKEPSLSDLPGPDTHGEEPRAPKGPGPRGSTSAKPAGPARP